MRKNKKLIVSILVLTFVLSSHHCLCQSTTETQSVENYEIINQTFLGNFERNYYGNIAPDTLGLIWKLYLGKGITTISRKRGDVEWAGAGWTGQPLLVKENNKLYIIQGAYDHNLKKIDAETGKIVWQYKFDDVIKGTGTIWEAPRGSESDNKLVILQGSRLGEGIYLDEKYIPSYRGISYFTGKELWRMNVTMTRSYSRDVDASALILDYKAYIGLENSLFTVFSPDYTKARIKDNMLQPIIYSQTKLYNQQDVVAHGGNLVTESSPAILDSIIYIASGTGHIYGYSLKENSITWDFYIGSDIDGSAVVTSDSCIIVTAEKQYISGNGGAFKLNPRKEPEDAVVWFMPADSAKYAGWEGGVIGSVSVNDSYNSFNTAPLAAFTAIDGHLYVVNHKMLDKSEKVFGPNKKHQYYKPQLVFRYKVGASISTPIIVNDKLIAAGYGGLYLFEFNSDLKFERIAKFGGTYEATPVVHNGRIYVASRNGYFYCLGK